MCQENKYAPKFIINRQILLFDRDNILLPFFCLKVWIIFPIHIDTARSKIEIVDEDTLTLGEAIEQDENSMKNLLKKKWKEVSKI